LNVTNKLESSPGVGQGVGALVVGVIVGYWLGINEG